MSCIRRALERLTSKQVRDHPVRPHLHHRQLQTATATLVLRSSLHYNSTWWCPIVLLHWYNYKKFLYWYYTIGCTTGCWNSCGHAAGISISDTTAVKGACAYTTGGATCALAGAVGRLALDGMQARHRGDIDDVAMPAESTLSHSGIATHRRCPCSAQTGTSLAGVRK